MAKTEKHGHSNKDTVKWDSYIKIAKRLNWKMIYQHFLQENYLEAQVRTSFKSVKNNLKTITVPYLEQLILKNFQQRCWHFSIQINQQKIKIKLLKNKLKMTIRHKRKRWKKNKKTSKKCLKKLLSNMKNKWSKVMNLIMIFKMKLVVNLIFNFKNWD